MSDKAVIVLRVSTAQQGESGLGLTAQENAACDFCAKEGWRSSRCCSTWPPARLPPQWPRHAEVLRLLSAQEAAALVSTRADRLTPRKRRSIQPDGPERQRGLVHTNRRQGPGHLH